MTLKGENSEIGCFFDGGLSWGQLVLRARWGEQWCVPAAGSSSRVIHADLTGAVAWLSLTAASCIQFPSFVLMAATFIICLNIGRLNAVRRLLNRTSSQRGTICSLVFKEEEKAVHWVGCAGLLHSGACWEMFFQPVGSSDSSFSLSVVYTARLACFRVHSQGH